METPSDPDRATIETDAQLVERCRQGEAAAWSALVRRYQRLVYTVPRRAGLDDARAADVLQETFAALVKHLQALREPERLQAWLVTTARRETLRSIRLARRSVEPASFPDDEDGDATFDPVDPAPGPDALLEDLQAQQRLRLALDGLDGRCRTLIEWLYGTEDPPAYAEIGRRLGVPEGSIGPTRARCLQKLRALIREDAS